MFRRQFLLGSSSLAIGAGLPGCSFSVEADKGWMIDGLSFLPDDLGDVRESGLNGYIADISDIEEIKQLDGTINYKRTYSACMKSIREAREVIQKHPDIFRLALTGKDLQRARENDQCAVFFQIQGADCVEENLGQVNEFYNLGLRVLQLTHHYGNDYAGGTMDVVERGLSKRGAELIERLNDLKMLIDLSHSSPQSAMDTLALSQFPVVQTHGAARALVDNARCSPDEVIRGIGDSGGAFGVFMMSFWLTREEKPLPEHFVDHIRHIINIAGVDTAAIANDYPLRGQKNLLKLNNNNTEGVKQYLDWWSDLRKNGIRGFDIMPTHVVIPEFNHIDRMSRIHDHLTASGFARYDVDKIMGGNWKRILENTVI